MTTKQHITKEQWIEINEDNQNLLINGVLNDYTIFPWELITIGQMIEFIGDDLYKIGWVDRNIREVKVNQKGRMQSYQSQELVDALWEAVKYKLKQ